MATEVGFLEFGAGRMDPWSGRNFQSAKTWEAIASVLLFDPHCYC